MSIEFPFPEDVRKLLIQAISRLVNLRKATPRLRLRQHLKGRKEILDQLISERYLVERERDNYVPGIAAFETCGDDFLLSLAKSGTGTVLHTLQNLYEVETPKTSFTLNEVKEHAKKLYMMVEDEKIEVGLSMIADPALKVLAGWDAEDGLI